MSATKKPFDHSAPSYSSSAPRTLSPGTLRIMAEEGSLSPGAYEAALRFWGIRPGPRQWHWFWQRILSSWGTLFFAAGLICFFAYNWEDMHYFAKFALVASCILVAGLVAVWRGLDSLEGKLALVLASLCVGPLLAVYGQTYQTGADAWELFRAWTLAIVPLALVGRSAALWLLVWLAGSAWGELYLLSMPGWHNDFIPGVPEFFLAQALCLAGWEVVAHYWKSRPGHSWLAATWLPRIIGFVTLAALTSYLASRIFSDYWPSCGTSLFLPTGSACTALYVCLLLGGWLWYRKKRPDLFMLSCGLFSLATLLVCALIKVNNEWDAGSFLLWGLVIAGLTTGCGLVLRRLHLAMEAEKAAQPETHSSAPGFLEKFQTRFSWEALWHHLREANLLAGDPPPIPNRSPTPWYIAAQLAVGGWIAAIFLVCFLGSFLYMTLGIRAEPEIPLFIGGIAFLAVGGLLMRREAIFTEQFALALAIAGVIAVSAAVVFLIHSERTAPLAVAFVIAATYPFMRNSAYRHLAAVFGLLLFFWGLDFLIWNDMYGYLGHARHNDLQEAFQRMHVRQAMHATWHSVLCVVMTYGWLAERTWRTDARLNGLLPPVLHGMYGVLLVSLVVSLLNRSMGNEFQMLEPLRGMVGIGAGIGLVYCAYMMTRTLAGISFMRPFFLGLAVLASVGGWFLPGISAGLLGLALARHRGDTVALGVTIAALAAYFFCYYYNQDTTLLYKSLTLMGSGTGLCVAGFCIHRAAKQEPAATMGGDHA